MKLWLDDERPAPEGWLHAETAWQAIAWLASGKVVECSLDHDLGPERYGNGYLVLKWLEEQAFFGRVKPLVINIHTANPAAMKRMLLARKSIMRFWGQAT